MDALGSFFAVLAAVAVFQAVFGIIAYVWFALALGGMARKAGQPTWAGWVPIFNVVVFYRMAAMSPLWWLIAYFGAVLTLSISNGLASTANSFETATIISTLGLVIASGLLLVGVINFCIAIHRVNGHFGLGGGYTFLGIFFQLIWMSMLAWGSAQWIGPAAGAHARTVRPAVPDAVPVAAAPAVAAGPTPPPPPAMAPRSAAPVAPTPPRSSATPPPVSQATPLSAPQPPPAAASPSVSTIPAPMPPALPAPSSPGRSPWEPPITSAPVVAAPVSPVAPAPVLPPPPAMPVLPPPPPVPPAPAGVVPPAPAATTVSAPQAPTAPPSPPAWAAPAPTTPRQGWAPDDLGIDSATVAAPSFVDESDDVEDRTVVVPRIVRARFSIVLADGQSLPLTADEVILGRRPTGDSQRPGAQLLAVPDATKTTSKNHAYLQREGESWTITDLASTNGVATYAADGTETVLQSGVPTIITGDFALGQARMRIAQES